MKLNRKTAFHVGLCTLYMAAVLVMLLAAGYIDLRVIWLIYLPLYGLAAGAMLFRQYIFGHIFGAAAVAGLLVEYALHLQRLDPNMSGAFLNTLIVACGLVIGIAAQVAAARRKQPSGR